ncbi:class I SAM-dependent methyltransferase [Saccharolobus solfataricus]|uniref:Class I SAM-dependent methyltransferase n=2 Tax=Saccharolobus solfataricus TaxID=2287 RepID=A0A0E3KA76_SACSO|nr:class I SAM-dependent methyltransferase [Saccharolobus solfataricus]AKA74664.1 class I SAM-dependent methyltransferase [Saccharolobus solfataricus]AKA77358.1 class I SAM-dependent methyltransferase [Saccharolobus solfataricus]AKA80049.1 class I SAM-dependent methyltransferase [Saccharolobus solfataricus]AZF69128.1 class I SAM-dependent methyltransferase [Saccharolobus solfataricus]AZF71748.1 class I SAM-dependent methyltransferase [Saccharolobus solfataricus]
MCTTAVIEFFIDNIDCEELQGKRVIEVGSRYVNGSVRPLIERFCKPKEYIGVDIEKGKFVDIVLSAEKLIERFGENSFDVVISTEMLEHVKDWRIVVNNMKLILKPMGYIYITTRSLGFPYHSYPYDFWRYEVEDMENIFSDFEIIKIMRDPIEPGVFLKARKPLNFKLKDLSNVMLYSMLTRKREKDIPDKLPIRTRMYLLYQNFKNHRFIR